MRKRVIPTIQELRRHLVFPRHEALVNIQQMIGPDPATTATIYENDFVDDSKELCMLRRSHDCKASVPGIVGVARLFVQPPNAICVVRYLC